MESDVCYVIVLTKTQGAKLPEALIRAHVAHLKRLEDAGRLLLCGPFDDGGGGMAVIRAESLEAARTVAEADPFVASGLERYEIRTLHLSHRGNNHMGFGD